MAMERVVPVQVPDILNLSKVESELKEKGITDEQLKKYREFLQLYYVVRRRQRHFW